MAHRRLPHGIPTNARRVFRGSFFDIYQWRQKLYDGSQAIFEMVARPETVIVIPITDSGRIVLIEQEQAGRKVPIGLPGGVVDAGETPRHAALRELREETGYVPQKLTRWLMAPMLFRTATRIHAYVAHGCRKHSAPTPDAGEHIQSRTVSFDRFLYIAGYHAFRHPQISIEALRALTQSSRYRKLKRRFGFR